ncbi:cytochrome P450 [Laetiporus sulphureus 93-53]|uniref:Cytochrome P450 n=1 Tax=Laetiporus sulphureus 93-53 TaxID=1314785 RepID=A0A165BDU1_9APHY|nr:cytochrome P450 [Laetiporus sulphureus 93-53]KZT00829.1 cytochrome P450 [Laetiporus sulphureus 93-53]
MAVHTAPLQAFGLTITACISWRIARWLAANKPLDNLPGPPSQSSLYGNVGQYFDRCRLDSHLKVVQNYGPIVRLREFFGVPVLYIYDPLALQAMLVKNQNQYEQYEEFTRQTGFMFGHHLLAIRGEEHRRQRKLMNPAFSPNRLRTMLPIFYSVARKVRVALATRVDDASKEIDILHWLGRASLEIIGQGSMGWSLDSLVSEGNNQYAEDVKVVLSVCNFMEDLTVSSCSRSAERWRRVVDVLPYEPLRNVTNIFDRLYDKKRQVYAAKVKNTHEGDGLVAVWEDPDDDNIIISVLVKAHVRAPDDEKIPIEEVFAQISTFIFAAIDTASNTIARALERLAHHQDVQERLHKEILDASDGKDLPFERLMQLPYVDAVCRESLRLRVGCALALVDNVVPLSQPICGTDGHSFMG